ncbi:MAG TPA: hypothetical protein PL048_00590 [Leptospiraceae bacterium]|nr:hypothetical protein [Leptospiraceae bacterium]
MNRKENAAKVSFSEYSEEVMNMRTLLENLAEQLRNQPKVRKRKLYKKVRISRKKYCRVFRHFLLRKPERAEPDSVRKSLLRARLRISETRSDVGHITGKTDVKRELHSDPAEYNV